MRTFFCMKFNSYYRYLIFILTWITTSNYDSWPTRLSGYEKTYWCCQIWKLLSTALLHLHGFVNSLPGSCKSLLAGWHLLASIRKNLIKLVRFNGSKVDPDVIGRKPFRGCGNDNKSFTDIETKVPAKYDQEETTAACSNNLTKISQKVSKSGMKESKESKEINSKPTMPNFSPTCTYVKPYGCLLSP